MEIIWVGELSHLIEDYIEPDWRKISQISTFSANANPTVPHALSIVAYRLLVMDAIEIAIFLNEDPDTQAAIVGGIYSNSIAEDDECLKR